VTAAPLNYPMARTCPFHPPEPYARLRTEDPITEVVTPDGGAAWLVTGYEHVRALLVDPRVSSSRAHPNMPVPVPVTPEIRRESARVADALLGLDPPEHSAPRRLLMREFTVQRARALRPRIVRSVDECLDRMVRDGSPADLVEALSLPVPLMTICHELGVRYDDHRLFLEWTRALISTRASADERRVAMAAMYDYLDRLVSDKEREPTDDILGRLVLRNRDARVFDHEGLVGIAQFLLVAGHETTANMISLGVVGLLTNPDQAERVRRSPASARRAVDEILRYFTIIDTLPRVATEDVEIGGTVIPAGGGIVLALGSANRDERVFPGPDRLDVGRAGSRHVSFAYGVHQCLGQHIARTELEVVFTRLLDRLPGLRLAVPVDELPFKDDANVYGIHRVPVAW
jgi:cytochrome P450